MPVFLKLQENIAQFCQCPRIRAVYYPRPKKTHTPPPCRFAFSAASRSARRLVQQNAVTLDDEKITDICAEITPRSGAVLKVGKRRFGKIVIA